MKDHQLPVIPGLFFECKRVDFEEGQEFGAYLAKHPDLADAVFCVTDEVAMGTIMGLKKNGIKIPEQIAIVGFSDWEMAEVVEPSLSSVHQPGYELGKSAAKILIQEIVANKNEEPFFYDTTILKTHLKIRDSSRKKTS
jgi:LacI family transcriptional regulator